MWCALLIVIVVVVDEKKKKKVPLVGIGLLTYAITIHAITTYTMTM